MRKALAMLAALVTVAVAAPVASAAAEPELITRTRNTGKYVAFTFDDGPSPAHTPQLLDVLRRNNAKAVFCLVGDMADWNTALIKRIVDEGHTLCNHSMRHSDMETLTPDQIRADIKQTADTIRRAVPNARIPYFRAPYGHWGASPAVAAELGYKNLSWTLMPGDWELPGTDELVRRIRAGLTETGVITLHDAGGDRSQTVAAMERLLPQLAAEGWKFDLPA
ncbi:polysaccharide deacetylase family protein [Kibdelosporangium phytohabitans]|uniref:Xylanase n=1 Tax=Kibdelosporangium phytohabitans TaxID=860235 RepID=A0A0N9I276_9PSEU|nr:polysaccharide deacetylase family protein [Kibdelosporangium phytohabitans]ALG08534.1 xylanase [Kibdelosporangium phytohabitans]MBE1470392.1 peptidoglycan/xylan/chitin deacetylase (PgdA/CDA1 family) [Kibdelosporangium phytohabitans]